METDRSWAVGLTQDQFTHEYLQRNPFSDVIPFGADWVNGKDLHYNGISGVKPEDFQAVDGPAKKVDVTQKTFACRGCGREFTHHLGRTAHERHCKVKIAGGA